MRESAYNLCVKSEGGDHFLFNTRTGAAHLFAAEVYRAYWAAVNAPAPLAGAAPLLAQFAKDGFLVDDDADELREIEARHRAARASRETLSLVLAPAMACNLDCAYCFEDNRYPGRMSDAVQANVVRLVRRSIGEGARRLAVTWYGGEPLLAFSAIRRLSEAILPLCEEAGCAYAAEIVTNGTLLTEERARLLAAWKVRRAQITLDGVPEIHNRRRVAARGGATFEQVLGGIEAAAGHMHVSVRINVCRDGAGRLEELLQILADRGLNSKVSLYLAPLRPMPRLTSDAVVRPPPAHAEGRAIAFMSGRERAALDLAFDALLRRYGFATHPAALPRPRSTACMADQDHSWLIEANGDVQKCDWTPGLRDEAVGRLAPEGVVFTDARRKWRDWNVFADEDCAACVMLPLCLGLCPLRAMAGDADNCPAFKHNWPEALARAANFGARTAAARLALAGARISRIRLRDLERLVSADR